MNILYIYSDEKSEWNGSEWRVVIPKDAINRSGLASAHMVAADDFAQGFCIDEVERADIVVIQRNLFGAAVVWMLNWRFLGKPFVVDLDDAYHVMPPSVLSAPFWRVGQGQKDGKPFQLPFSPLQQLEFGARLVNAITSPSPVLVDYWSKTAPAYLVPNYPRTDVFIQAYENLPTTDEVVIGWGGSFSHVDSFCNSNVIPAIRRITENHNVKLRIAGGDHRLLRTIKIRDAQAVPWAPYDKWPETLRGFSVGIAPLSGAYDDARSWIKVLEYMLMGIPWVASDAKPYQIFREYGTLVKNQSKAWEAAIENALARPNMEQIKAAREYALTFSVDNHVEELLATYQKIIDERRPVL